MEKNRGAEEFQWLRIGKLSGNYLKKCVEGTKGRTAEAENQMCAEFFQEKATDAIRNPCNCDQKYCAAMANREMLKSVKTVPLLSCPVKQEDLNPTDSTVSKILIVYTEKERKLWT